MSKEQPPGKPTMRRYAPEVKAAAVRMVCAGREELGSDHGTVQRVARQLGDGIESVRSWVRQADIDDGHRTGVSTTESARVKDLEQEIRELKRANRDTEASGEFLRGGARPPTQQVVAFIDAHRGEFGVEPVCITVRSAGVQVAPSTYYANKARTPSARDCRHAVVGPALQRLWEDNYRVYGARKLWKAARRAGHDVGPDQVARHMRAAGIVGARRDKRLRTNQNRSRRRASPGSGQAQPLVEIQ